MNESNRQGECLVCAKKKNTSNRRKTLVIDSIKNLSELFKSKHISLTIKIRLFIAFINSVMLYNSELWALTETLNEKIDAFQRKQLRNILEIKWPKTITNKKLYKITKIEPLSITIKRKRLKWTGHLARLDPLTPARRSLKEALEPIKRKQGRPPHTWIKQFVSDIKETKIIETNSEDTAISIFERLEQTAHDRKLFREKINRCIPQERCLRK